MPILSDRKAIVLITIAFLFTEAQGKELYKQTIDWYTGRNSHPISFERTNELASILTARGEIVGICVLGSFEQLKGNARKAQEYYFNAYSSGNLFRYAQFEPDVGHFFLGEYYMLADPIDPQKANEHYKKSADLGFGPAMASYGVNRLIGNGISTNRYEAKKYLIMGMGQDNPHSYYNFAIYLLSIAKDRKTTAKAYLEYASYRGFKIADKALEDWFTTEGKL